jgi:peptidoglycan/LPS O-acetylase OafA/YrhL
MKRIPCLDGLRALSIGMVLIGHANGTRALVLGSGEPRSVHFDLSLVGDVAHLGVRVFFVLSGFLITTLLLQERERTGTLDLKGFYVRRTCRIFPAFYVYLAVVGALSLLSLASVSPADLACAATYMTNFHPNRAWLVGHLWSLSVEEQFYLLWPATMLLLGASRARRVVVGALFAAPLARLGWHTLWPGHDTYIGEAFPTVMDAIATGCLLAMTRATLEANPRYMRWLRSRALWLVVPAAFVVNHFADHARVFWLVGESIQNLAIFALVHRVVVMPDTLAGRVLEWRPLAFVGTLSYSLYLWQQPFMNRTSGALTSSFPLNIGLAFAAALASYYLVEQPLLRYRARHAGEPSSSRPAPLGHAVEAVSRASV